MAQERFIILNNILANLSSNELYISYNIFGFFYYDCLLFMLQECYLEKVTIADLSVVYNAGCRSEQVSYHIMHVYVRPVCACMFVFPVTRLAWNQSRQAAFFLTKGPLQFSYDIRP